MSKVTLMPGPCKLKTVIEAEKLDRRNVTIKIMTECANYKPLEQELNQVNTFEEVLGKLGSGKVYEMCSKYSKHPSCPLPCAILKAVEVAAGMALPVDVNITVEK